jgi:hypothetical protein
MILKNQAADNPTITRAQRSKLLSAGFCFARKLEYS